MEVALRLSIILDISQTAITSPVRGAALKVLTFTTWLAFYNIYIYQYITSVGHHFRS